MIRHTFNAGLKVHANLTFRPLIVDNCLVTGYLYKNIKNLNKSVKVRSYMFKYAKTESRKFETPPA